MTQNDASFVVLNNSLPVLNVPMLKLQTPSKPISPHLIRQPGLACRLGLVVPSFVKNPVDRALGNITESFLNLCQNPLMLV
jgi:hypothetical protein